MLVDADIPASLNLLGKQIGDLQDEIEIDRFNIRGNLHYLTDYTGFSGEVSEQGGNYLCLHFSVPGITHVTFTVQLIGGTHGPVTLDADGICIFRITSNEQSILVRVSRPGCRDVARTYDLSGVVLEHVAECGTQHCGEQ